MYLQQKQLKLYTSSPDLDAVSIILLLQHPASVKQREEDFGGYGTYRSPTGPDDVCKLLGQAAQGTGLQHGLLHDLLDKGRFLCISAPDVQYVDA